MNTEADPAAVWHDVECGAYSADLRLWEELAGGVAGSILELGCGTGRVALHLARRGHEVVGLDSDRSLLGAFRAQADGLPARAEVGDATDFDLGTEFGAVLAPMQLVQLLPDGDERLRCLHCIAAHLRAGGLAAFAIVEEMPAAVDASPPLPDTREVGGWVYSSLPIEAEPSASTIRVRRLRQTVSPAGVLSEEVDEVQLRTLNAETLEREAAVAGLEAVGRRAIPPTEAHVGSTVVLLKKEE